RNLVKILIFRFHKGGSRNIITSAISYKQLYDSLSVPSNIHEPFLSISLITSTCSSAVRFFLPSLVSLWTIQSSSYHGMFKLLDNCFANVVFPLATIPTMKIFFIGDSHLQ